MTFLVQKDSQPAAAQSPSLPTSSLGVDWRAAEVQEAEQTGLSTGEEVAGAMITQTLITFGLLILTSSPGSFGNLPSHDPDKHCFAHLLVWIFNESHLAFNCDPALSFNCDPACPLWPHVGERFSYVTRQK